MLQSVGVTRVKETRDELRMQLEEQRRFLAMSGAAFDAGDHAEAKRIASTLRVLLDGVGSTPPLLARLGTRERIGWLDTAGSMLPLEGSAQTPLVFAVADERPAHEGAMWLPTLDAWDRRLRERRPLSPDMEETLARMRADRTLRSRGSWLPFAEWWEADVLRDTDGQSFTRADLLRAMTNTDGEVLAGPNRDAAHRRISAPGSSGWVTARERRTPVPPLSPALASVRQVAYEVERSLLRREPVELIADGTAP